MTMPVLLSFIAMILAIVYCTAVITASLFHKDTTQFDVFKIVSSVVIGALFIATFILRHDILTLFNGLMWFVIATLNYLTDWNVNK